jgi:serine/threonine-protein kinase HipA
VNGKRNNITRDDLLSVARQMNIKKAASIVTHVNDIVNKWPEYAEEIRITPALRDVIDKTLIDFTG